MLRSRLFGKAQKTPSICLQLNRPTPLPWPRRPLWSSPALDFHHYTPASLNRTSSLSSLGTCTCYHLPSFSHGCLPTILVLIQMSPPQRCLLWTSWPWKSHSPSPCFYFFIAFTITWHISLFLLCLPTRPEYKLHKSRNTVCLVYSSISSTLNRVHHKASAP